MGRSAKTDDWDPAGFFLTRPVSDDPPAWSPRPLAPGVASRRRDRRSLPGEPANATFDPELLRELIDAVELFEAIGQTRDEPLELRRFREAFVRRYEMQAVPLTEVLDDERGLGRAARRMLSATSEEPRTDAELGPIHVHLLQRLASLGDARELVLGPADRAALARRTDGLERGHPRVPSVAVRAQWLPRDATTEAHAHMLAIDAVAGPATAALRDRLGALEASPAADLHARLAELRAREMELDPEGPAPVFVTPPAWAHDEDVRPSGPDDIPILPVEDLALSAEGARLVLRSRQLGWSVNAYPLPGAAGEAAWSVDSALLARLREQNAPSLGFSWGPLAAARFLPRVRLGRLVLAWARWHLDDDDLAALRGRSGAALRRAVELLRQRFAFPDAVLLARPGGATPVLLRFDDPAGIEALGRRAERVQALTLIEHPVASFEVDASRRDESPDAGQRREPPDHVLAQEVLIPLIRGSRTQESLHRPSPRAHVPSPAGERRPVTRRFPPGSEWLFVKLYASDGLLDDLLIALAPVLEAARAAGVVTQWFFIRYADPDHHLRLRLRGAPAQLLAEVLPAIERATAPWRREGGLWRVELDTYVREIERYGGPEGIELAELLFHVDSEAVLGILRRVAGEARHVARGRLALLGADRLLDDLGLAGSSRRQVVHDLRSSYASEFRADRKLLDQVGSKYRAERAAIDALFTAAGACPPAGTSMHEANPASHPLAPCIELLERRSKHIVPIAARLRALAAEGRLAVPLSAFASSVIHLHLNRLLRGALRAQEMVLYDFLERVHESRDHHAAARREAEA
ncbi:thiopeptide-type bacteriocin biosynthesis domain-containing protein [Nannocystis exedens]|uniref:Thiopeptide-type bacteriocin biosynthesis domain-containing protein n=1 Tax=Nannocystis exedens TaxID=54 RepID=A0A1I2GR98_9BACT|nr:thiopeptide-type bacteriocin biosynthesis protein [Nannocystis exedens]PCC68742.1 lanthionine biosynthesis protein LanB [Nannocystis exedens]SFF19539.1 thiopeptide-type bacteriocin biosynthesis domain-containing protein [Nannocystis exedens]